MIYILVSNHSAQDLVEEVNEWIAKGFVPQGGVTSVPIQGKAEHQLVQAIVSVDEPEVIAEPIKTPQPRDIKVVKTASELRGMFPVLKVRYSYKDKLYGIEMEDMDRDITRDSVILACLEDIMARGV